MHFDGLIAFMAHLKCVVMNMVLNSSIVITSSWGLYKARGEIKLSSDFFGSFTGYSVSQDRVMELREQMQDIRKGMTITTIYET